MKISTAAILLSLSGASAYSVTRSSLRSLGQKTVKVSSPSRSVEPQMKMEDFGLFGGTGIGFDDLWGGEQCISEVGLENRLNQDGLRYKMNRTPEEEVDGWTSFQRSQSTFLSSEKP